MFELANVRMEEFPFRWGAGQNVLEDEIAVLASREFPSALLEGREGLGEKFYSMRSLTLIDRSVDPAVDDRERVPGVFERIVAEVDSASFRLELGAYAGVSLEAAKLEVRLTEYVFGHELGPHTDRPDKLLSLIVYLGGPGSATLGGELCVLMADALTTFAKVAPKLGSVGIIVRSEDSWHSVARVQRGVRRSILVHYYR